ncbi:hypothetical protein HBH53_230100 [Parastagonospora nodorum]|nr:hypothetical protein HBH53_230100 [Parastagonospora nodorum]KAH4219479.1 hypothetical protein HBI05_257020 [Parastagonospora nodorum]KAH4881032.1 hypothetical protein HBH74_243500 [Parastagonospora nodorum]KAH4892695.1 hypothetical protein HBI80_255870 [Parastagonospora nodorum]KAH5087787.1 hypothetical protein HBH72_251430 [Parastagonospora nodorum]
MSAEAAESYRGAVCLPFSDISSTTQSRTAVVALLIAMVSLGYCHRWWRRQQPRANGLVRSIAQIAAWAAIAAVCMMTILYIGFRFVTDTPWEPSILPAEKNVDPPAILPPSSSGWSGTFVFAPWRTRAISGTPKATSSQSGRK